MEKFPIHLVHKAPPSSKKQEERFFTLKFPAEASIELAEKACLYCPLAFSCTRVKSGGFGFAIESEDDTSVTIELEKNTDLAQALCGIKDDKSKSGEEPTLLIEF